MISSLTTNILPIITVIVLPFNTDIVILFFRHSYIRSHTLKGKSSCNNSSSLARTEQIVCRCKKVFSQGINSWSEEKFSCQWYSGITRENSGCRQYEQKLWNWFWRWWSAARGADMFQLLVNTLWYGAAFVFFVAGKFWNRNILLPHPGKDSRVNPVSQNIYFMSVYILSDNQMFSVNYM